MAQQPTDHLCSVKDIATFYHIPESLLAKVMQKLKVAGFTRSIKGSAGGYQMLQAPSDVSFREILQLFDEQTSLVDCMEPTPCSCQQQSHCDIKLPLQHLNRALTNQLAHLTLADFFAGRPPTSVSRPTFPILTSAPS